MVSCVFCMSSDQTSSLFSKLSFCLTLNESPTSCVHSLDNHSRLFQSVLLLANLVYVSYFCNTMSFLILQKLREDFYVFELPLFLGNTKLHCQLTNDLFQFSILFL